MKRNLLNDHFPDGRWRIVLLVMTFLLCSVGTSAAASTALPQAKLTVDYRSQSIAAVLNDLKAQTGYTFVRQAGVLNAPERVTLSMQDATLEQVLEKVLGEKGYSYDIEEGMVTITKSQTVQQPAALQVVTGTVRDIDGKPIVGASVQVKGVAGRGTATDVSGRYRLSIAGVGNPVVVVSFMGMMPREFTPSGTGVHNVTLAADVTQLDAVQVTVNTGYTEADKDHMTGSYSTVLGKDLENSIFMSLDQALDGKVAGLLSTSTSGAPGTRAEIRIRGNNSINGNKEPLWVVDGLPLLSGVVAISDLTHGDIQQSILDHGVGNLAPSDIESVTILKDAAATAIYGARAANGVIVVKTKRGGAGPVTINYQGNFALGEAPRMKDFGFMNAAEKVAFEIDLMEEFQQRDQNGGLVSRLWDDWKRGAVTDEYYNNKIAELSSVNMNWFDEIYRLSFSHNHNLSMRAGTDKFWFYGSMNARDEKGALKTNRYNAFGANLKSGYRPHDNVMIDVGVNANFRESNDHASVEDPFRYAVFANPYEKAYNADGTWAADQTWLGDKSLLSIGNVHDDFNILRELEQTKKRQKASDISGTLSATWQIKPTLSAEVHGRLGYSTNHGDTWAAPGTYTSRKNYWTMEPFGGNLGELPDKYNNGYAIFSSGNSVSFSSRAQISYNETFADKHHLSAFAGTEITSAEAWSDRLRLAQYDPTYYFGSFPDYPWMPGFTTAMQGSVGSMGTYTYGNKDRTASFFSAFTYSYQDRYVFNANVRFDGAGTIDKANRFTPLWSASARWNLHHENFVKDNVPWITELAVRGVFGYTGNIDHRALPYPWLILGGTQYDGTYMSTNLYFPNPSIKWERKIDRNLGLDFAFFDNMFGGSFNYYNNITKDLLGVTTTPPSYSNPRLTMNGHSLLNRGWELNFNVRVPIGEHVRWLTSFNISRNTNRVKNSNMADPSNFNDPNMSNYWAGFTANDIENYPVGTTFGYRYAGVNPANGEAMFHLSDAARQAYAAAYGIELADAPATWEMNNTAGVGNGLNWNQWYMMSMTDIGHQYPDYYGGFMTAVQYKKFELRASFSYSVGQKIRTFDGRNFVYTSNNQSNTEMYGARLNALKSTVNRWRAPGDATDTPRFTKGSSRYFIMNTDDRFKSGDYLSFNDLSLSYNVEAPFMQRVGVKYLRVGMQVSNLAVFSKFRSTDVTTGNAFGYPRTRKWMLNLSMTF